MACYQVRTGLVNLRQSRQAQAERVTLCPGPAPLKHASNGDLGIKLSFRLVRLALRHRSRPLSQPRAPPEGSAALVRKPGNAEASLLWRRGVASVPRRHGANVEGAKLRRGVRRTGGGRPDRVSRTWTVVSEQVESALGRTRAFVTRLSEQTRSIAEAVPRRRFGHDELDRMTMSELLYEARRLGVPGRSKMGSRQLAEAIRRADRETHSSTFVDRGLAAVALLSRPIWRLRGLSVRRLTSTVRGLPTRPLILSLVMLAAGALGLVLAYLVAPGEDVGAQLVRASRSLRIETVTGPGGTTTFVVTKTKNGKTKRVPVRIFRTITDEGGIRTVAVQVAGPGATQTVTQVHQNTETKVVTVVEPVTVTNVVTQLETVVVTETVVVPRPLSK